MREHRTALTVLTGLGTVATVTGVALPWFRVDPLFDPVVVRFPVVYDGLAGPGVHGPDPILLGVPAILALSILLGNDRRLFALLTTAAGVGIVSLCSHYVIFSPAIGFRGDVVPGTGWYLTILGGLLFVGTGLVEKIRHRPW